MPNRAARSLVTRRSDSIAVVIPEPTTRLFGDPFFPRVLRGISEALDAEESMQLVLLMPQARSDEERVERYLAAGHGDGVLLISLHGSDPLPERLRRHGVPIVVGGRPPSAGSPYVDVDNRGGAGLAVQHLIDGGPPAGCDDRRTAGHGPRRRSARRLSRPARGRRPSARAAPSSSSPTSRLTVDVPPWSASSRAPRPSTRSSSHRTSWPSAPSQHCAPPAGRFRMTWRSSGSMTRPWRARRSPSLSSVRQPIEEMGREMTRLLMQEIRAPGGAPRRVILETQLVVRGVERRRWGRWCRRQLGQPIEHSRHVERRGMHRPKLILRRHGAMTFGLGYFRGRRLGRPPRSADRPRNPANRPMDADPEVRRCDDRHAVHESFSCCADRVALRAPRRGPAGASVLAFDDPPGGRRHRRA